MSRRTKQEPFAGLLTEEQRQQLDETQAIFDNPETWADMQETLDALEITAEDRATLDEMADQIRKDLAGEGAPG